MHWRTMALWAALGGCGLLLGCGGPPYRVYGTVTFDGKKVPAGKVYILPDGTKGNTGSAGYADIKDGHFDTSSAGGRGAVAGPVILQVTGIDPNAEPTAAEKKASSEATARTLFSDFKQAHEIAGAGSVDIVVPKDAEKGAGKAKGDPKVIP